MSDVANLEGNRRELFQYAELREIFDVALTVILVVILPLALLKSVKARVRPSKDVREFEFAETFSVFGHLGARNLWVR